MPASALLAEELDLPLVPAVVPDAVADPVAVEPDVGLEAVVPADGPAVAPEAVVAGLAPLASGELVVAVDPDTCALVSTNWPPAAADDDPGVAAPVAPAVPVVAPAPEVVAPAELDPAAPGDVAPDPTELLAMSPL